MTFYSHIYTEHDTNPDKPKYRPPFLDHFDRKKTEPPTILTDLKALHQQQQQQVHASQHQAAAMQHQHAMSSQQAAPLAAPAAEFAQQHPIDAQPSAPSLYNMQQVQQDAERQRYLSQLQLQLNQISAANQMGLHHLMHGGDSQQQQPVEMNAPRDGGGAMKYQRNFVDGEFDFVSVSRAEEFGGFGCSWAAH